MSRVGMWYATGPADQTYTPGNPAFNLHRVVADSCDVPGYVLVENAGGSRFPVEATLIDQIAASPVARVKIAGNSFAPVPPDTDANGLTATEFMMSIFEFEDCAECHKDVEGHTAVIGPFGLWFAHCDKPEVT